MTRKWLVSKIAKTSLASTQGVPLSEREGGPPLLPDTITLFRRPIESGCMAREDVIREIKTTLRHEVGHYLGMSEEELERLGYG